MRQTAGSGFFGSYESLTLARKGIERRDGVALEVKAREDAVLGETASGERFDEKMIGVVKVRARLSESSRYVTPATPVKLEKV
jgi:hypothetical protein